MKYSELQIENRFWIQIEGQAFLGEGRVKLLQQINKTGSITKASKAMDMSYKKAWKMLNAMNELAKEPLFHRYSGGLGGGGTQLTMYGKRMIRMYQNMKEKYEHFNNKALNDLLDTSVFAETN